MSLVSSFFWGHSVLVVLSGL